MIYVLKAFSCNKNNILKRGISIKKKMKEMDLGCIIMY